jgi:CheY-like chemotaxis protein
VKSDPGSGDGSRKGCPEIRDPSKEERPGRPLRILAVENHPDTRRGLEMFLEVLGYDSRFAADMRSAIALAEAERFDVLLSDISLPDGNGWDLLRILEERGLRPAYAIATSGFGSPADLAKSREAGYQLHMVKPSPPKALADVLSKIPLHE